MRNDQERYVTLFSDLASAGPSGAAGGWIKIAPRGRVRARDGRNFSFNPDLFADRFKRDGVRVPVDFEHGTTHLAAKGQRNDAVGWIEELEARSDGLYGRVEWLSAGREALASRSYRYLSPGFVLGADESAAYLHHVALVNAPALPNMPALASAMVIEGGDDLLLSRLNEALGLAADASANEALELARKLRTADFSASSDAVKSLLLERASDDAAKRSRAATAVVDKAITDGVITPATRDWAVANCASDPAGFATFLTQLGTPYAHLFSSSISEEAERSVHQKRGEFAEEGAVKLAAQLGIDPKRIGGC